MAEERVHRRLAAILAADVVGYSRLMEADEEGTRARLRSLQAELIDPRIAADGGRIVKTMGDGILVEFPSAVDAVRNALAIQTAMAGRDEALPEDRRVMFRVGINVGDVIVEGDDIHGDGVNVASRLEGLCAPGEVYISGTVYDQAVGKLAVSFEDLGEQTVKNIAKPVRVYRTRAQSEETAYTVDTIEPLPLPDKPSIAVLPFDNLSGDPEQDYFSDGITEDIITELSRFRSLFVIARNSSFVFRGPSVDVADVSRKLGVQYVVEGSVRKAGNTVRVSVQLVDGSTTPHVWAERYDRELRDIFAVQDEITQAIVSALPRQLEDAHSDLAKRKSTANMTAYDLVLVGIRCLEKTTIQGNAEARRLSQNAIQLDPEYARAHALFATSFVWDAYHGQPTNLDEALESLEKALELDSEDSWSYAMLGCILFMQHQDEEAEIQFKKAIALNPNDANAISFWANNLVYLGRTDEALKWSSTAKRLNPFPPNWYHWYHALAQYSAHQYAEAIKTIKEMRPIMLRGQAYIAACYGHMNEIDQAHAQTQVFLAAANLELPQLAEGSDTTIWDIVLEWAARYRNETDREHFLDGLRKAGLPE